MQNNKSKGIRNFMKGKGYYIVLLVCAATVGVSGFFLFKDRQPAQNPDSSQSVQASAQPSVNVAPNTEKVKDAIATQGTPDAQATETKKMTVVRPVNGEQIVTYAADHLAFNETTRDWRTHEGADYFAELGTPVAAAADGSVYAIFEDENFGMTVVLQHPDGYTTHYANLSEEVSVAVGQTVKAGQTLGVVGQTACTETATRPHLHFGVFRNNVPVDPEEFLP